MEVGSGGGGGGGAGVRRLPRMSQVKYISSLKVVRYQSIKFPTDVCTGTGLVYNRLRPDAMVRAV